MKHIIETVYHEYKKHIENGLPNSILSSFEKALYALIEAKEAHDAYETENVKASIKAAK